MRRPVNDPFVITTEFGVPDSNAYFGFHSGVDYAGFGQGRAILAPADGQIWWAGWSNTGGNMIILFDGTYYHRLMHNVTMYVSQGNTVREGQHIADAGATGLAFGVHCHWDIATEMLSSLRPSSFNRFINPASWLASGKQGGNEQVINDYDNEYARMNDLFIRIRGR